MRRILFIIALLAILAANCSKPTPRDLDGKIKGKALLRLADGSTISRDGSDEYRPQIVKLNDGYLVLAFGANASCAGCTAGAHNIFMSKSLSPFTGVELPLFSVPKSVKPGSYLINEVHELKFALTPHGSAVKIYINDPNTNYIYKSVVSDPSNPDTTAGTAYAITNTFHDDTTILCANGAGDRLIGVDSSGNIFIFNPEANVSVNASYSVQFPNADHTCQYQCNCDRLPICL